jgi:diguanylate cyclase (GGDEF)-like protein
LRQIVHNYQGQTKVQKSIVQESMQSARSSVRTAYLATALIVAALVTERLIFQEVFVEANQQARLATTLAGNILLEDERLTMSANMAAATGEARWSERYEQRLKAMDEAISESIALAAPEVAAQFESQTKAANDALVIIETGALKAVAEKRLTDARSLLSLPVYQQQKNILAEGSDRFLESLDKSGLERINTTQKNAGLAIGAVLSLAGLGFFALWRKLNRSLSTSEAEYIHAEQRLVALALHDELTGLPNRRAFVERLDQMINEANGKDRLIAAALIDIDNFKDVNDTLGHQAGDELIQQIARRLRSLAPEVAFVARLGGDEFAIAATGLNEAAIKALIRSASEMFLQPIEACGQSLHVTVSAGITFAPNHQNYHSGDILRLADIALYRAKAEGRARAKIFDAGMDANMRERLALEADLRAAVLAGELNLHYQPLMSNDGARTTGVEALLRWTHPTRGEIGPSVFIPIAEQSNLIVTLGEWLLRRAFIDAQRWADITTAVNLSPRQFQHPEFPAVIRRLVQETGVNPASIELEITESLLMEESERVKRALAALREMGFRIALDDFGTGYSSLGYLRRFPFHKIKIDRSFINGIGASIESAQIIHSIVSLGHALKMSVTAEGVETAEQHRFLQAAGCEQLQGFLFAKAMSADDLHDRVNIGHMRKSA